MPWFNNVDVTKAGPANNGIIYLALREENGAWHRWFEADATIENEILATALTAVSTNKTVHVLLSDTAAYSTIQRFYVNA